MKKYEQETKKTPGVLLICGHPRSGTTLLVQVCNTHPLIALTHEFKCYAELNSSAEKHLGEIKKRGRPWHKFLLTLQIAPGASGKSVLDWLRSLRMCYQYHRRMRSFGTQKIGASDVTRVLASVLPEAAIVGDKYPGYIFMLDRLIEIPSVQIVVIYRDCRDVVSSCMAKSRSTWRGTKFGQRLGTPSGAATSWVNAVKLMEKHSDKIHIIRYESLILDPETELAILGKWLGVQTDGFESSMIRRNSIGRHRHGLTPKDLKVIDEIAGKQLRSFGYSD